MLATISCKAVGACHAWDGGPCHRCPTAQHSLRTCRQEPRLLGTLSFGSGSSICGVGLLAGGLLCAAGRMASGNVQVQAWELLGDGREVQVLPTAAAPNMVWDALQSMVGKAALAGAWRSAALGRWAWTWVHRRACTSAAHCQRTST